MTSTAPKENPSSGRVNSPKGSNFEYVFPAIRGVQAGHEYYITMCPLRLIPRIFLFDEEELVPEVRAQRSLNKARIPEMTRYILDNPTSYVFSALTASVDTQVNFEPFGEGGTEERVGRLTIPMSASFVINDGQHRRAAIQQALLENPDLGDESISIVLFLDVRLERCQQMFADLNRYAIRPSRSLGVLYDHRSETATITRLIVFQSDMLRDLTDNETSNLSARSRKLFTLSSFETAHRALLDGLDVLPLAQRVDLAASYWSAVESYVPEWRMVRDRLLTSGDVRRDFIHSHGIVLHALGKVGNTLLRESHDPKVWDRRLRGLSKLDWRRDNTVTWEGRALVAGKVSKTRANVLLTAAAIRSALGMQLPPDEKQLEDAFRRGDQ